MTEQMQQQQQQQQQPQQQSSAASSLSFKWVTALQKFNQDKEHKSPGENDKQADKQFLKLLEQQKEAQERENPSYLKIPKFFFKKQNTQNSLYIRVRHEARKRFLQNKTAEVLDTEDLQTLWYQMKDYVSQPDDGTQRINYDQFVYVSTLLPPKCRQFFTSSTFLKFERDEYGRIQIVPFFHYVVRKVNLFQTRIQISLYDSSGQVILFTCNRFNIQQDYRNHRIFQILYRYGYLKQKDLENYIFQLMPSFPQLQGLQENFYPFYVITAVRKFFFFLDPRRTGKIQIKDMLTSPILAQLYELRQERISQQDAANNWFSVHSALRVYEQYLKLDLDQNGMLKKSQLAKYSFGLTDIFIDRLFEEYQTFEGEMDYKTFLQFILAMKNKKTQQAIQYFWRILDVRKKGAIDTFTINMFFRSVITKLESKQKYGFKVDDVKDELWDMAKPKLPNAITLDDLLNCGVGDVITSMLIDAKAFYDYDQRESAVCNFQIHIILLQEQQDFDEIPNPMPILESSSTNSLLTSAETGQIHNTSI